MQIQYRRSAWTFASLDTTLWTKQPMWECAVWPVPCRAGLITLPNDANFNVLRTLMESIGLILSTRHTYMEHAKSSAPSPNLPETSTIFVSLIVGLDIGEKLSAGNASLIPNIVLKASTVIIIQTCALFQQAARWSAQFSTSLITEQSNVCRAVLPWLQSLSTGLIWRRSFVLSSVPSISLVTIPLCNVKMRATTQTLLMALGNTLISSWGFALRYAQPTPSQLMVQTAHGHVFRPETAPQTSTLKISTINEFASLSAQIQESTILTTICLQIMCPKSAFSNVRQGTMATSLPKATMVYVSLFAQLLPIQHWSSLITPPKDASNNAQKPKPHSETKSHWDVSKSVLCNGMLREFIEPSPKDTAFKLVIWILGVKMSGELVLKLLLTAPLSMDTIGTLWTHLQNAYKNAPKL